MGPPWFLLPPRTGQRGLVGMDDDSDTSTDSPDSQDTAYARDVKALLYALQNRPSNGDSPNTPTLTPNPVRTVASAMINVGAYAPLMAAANSAAQQEGGRLTLRGDDADDINARVQQFSYDIFGPPDPMTTKMLELGRTSFADQFVATPYPAGTGNGGIVAPGSTEPDGTASAVWTGGYDLPAGESGQQDVAPSRTESETGADSFASGAAPASGSFNIPQAAYLGARAGGYVDPETATTSDPLGTAWTSPELIAPIPRPPYPVVSLPPAMPTTAALPTQSLTADILTGLHGFRQRLDEVGEDPGTPLALRVAAAAVRAPASFVPNAAAAIAAPTGYLLDPNFRSQVNSSVGRFLSSRPVETVANAVGNYVGQRVPGGGVGALEALRDATELVGAGVPTGVTGKIAGILAGNAAKSGAQAAVKTFGPKLAQMAAQHLNRIGAIKYAVPSNGKFAVADTMGSILRPGEKYFPRRLEATFGTSTTKNYRATFFKAYPALKGYVVIHHAVEQQAMRRYPGLVSASEMHSLENLRGVPKGIDAVLHQKKIRLEWDDFYTDNPNPTKRQVLLKATEIDNKFGKQFAPPVR